MSKKYDVVCVVGEYTDNQGNQKKNYQNVGAVMSNDNGHYLLLDKTFNPAGLAEQGKRSIILSLFEPRENQQGQQRSQQGGGMNQQNSQEPPFDSGDIPFMFPPDRREFKF